MEIKVLKKDDIANLTVQAKGSKKFSNRCKWDSLSGQPVDIDISAFAFDGDTPIGMAYYGNLNWMDALVHSGDERTGDKAGWDEIMTLNSDKLPVNATKIIIIGNIYSPSGLAFKNMKNLEISIFDEEANTQLTTFLPAFEEGMADKNAVVLGEYIIQKKKKNVIFKALGNAYNHVNNIYDEYHIPYEK